MREITEFRKNDMVAEHVVLIIISIVMNLSEWIDNAPVRTELSSVYISNSTFIFESIW